MERIKFPFTERTILNNSRTNAFCFLFFFAAGLVFFEKFMDTSPYQISEGGKNNYNRSILLTLVGIHFLFNDSVPEPVTESIPETVTLPESVPEFIQVSTFKLDLTSIFTERTRGARCRIARCRAVPYQRAVPYRLGTGYFIPGFISGFIPGSMPTALYHNPIARHRTVPTCRTVPTWDRVFYNRLYTRLYTRVYAYCSIS